MNQIELGLLRTFVLAHELGSYAAAAETLGRTPSAVSMQMRRLEAEVGGPVLRRAPDGLVATSRGRLLLDYAKRIVALCDEALDRVHSIEMAGRVRLGVGDDYAETMLSGALARFRRQHPSIQIELTVDLSHNLLEGLRHGRLEIVVAKRMGLELDCNYKVLRKTALVWVGAAQQEFPLAERPLDLVVFPEGAYPRREMINALDAAGLRWRIAAACHSLEGLRASVAAGLGISALASTALVPSLSTLADLPSLPMSETGVFWSESQIGPAARRMKQALLTEPG